MSRTKTGIKYSVNSKGQKISKSGKIVVNKDMIQDILFEELDKWGSVDIDAILDEMIRAKYLITKRNFLRVLSELALEGKIEVEDNIIIGLQ